MSPPLLLKTKKENKKIPVSEYLRGFFIFPFLGLFLFQSKTQHHAVVTVCQ